MYTAVHVGKGGMTHRKRQKIKSKRLDDRVACSLCNYCKL